MPLYMDLHKLGASVTAAQCAASHIKDLEVQEKCGVKFLTYWFNEDVGKIYCLVEAPSVNAVVAVHREAHGLVPDEIIEVEAVNVEGFLGKVEETAAAREPAEPHAESAFRIIMFTDLEGSTALTQRLGDAKAMELLRAHNAIIRDTLAATGGREVKHTGDGIMASFLSVSTAVECAIAIQEAFAAYNAQRPNATLGVRVGLSAGEPVAEDEDLFGTAVQLAARVCDKAEPRQILASNVVQELAAGKGFTFADNGEAMFKGFDKPVRLHEVRWREN
jgi:class 3 adenylate cyclase